MRLAQKLFTPRGYAFFRHAFAKLPRFSLLDIGCGNHGARTAKYYLPNCLYSGLDRSRSYNNNAEDFSLMERFYEQNLEHNVLDGISERFDAILISHVIEHVATSNLLLSNLYKICKPNARVYIEFPGARSLAMPSAEDTFNFCDDPTHVRIYSAAEVANLLLRQGFVIVRAGTLRQLQAWIKLPYWLLINFFRIIIGKKIISRGFWQICGVTEFVEAIYMPKRQKTAKYFPS